VLVRATPGLEVNSNLDITVDPHTMRTSLQGVYAGGDVVGGEGTVIEAMGMAKKAAGSILKCLESLP
jgi:glutamate synthase (NADPH/NADH) small chain